MKKKVNFKTILIVVVMLLVMFLLVVAVNHVRVLFSGATSDIEPNGVTAVSSEDGKSAVITWSSEKESVAKVEYGTTAASLVLMTADSVATSNHSLTLNSLRSGTKYYYRIRIGDDVFDDGGMPYMFTTKGEDITSQTFGPSPTVPVSLPTTNATTSKKVCDPKIDYNKDGIVNSFDLITCKNEGGVVSTPSVKTAVDCNSLISDYNSDGVINSLDRINCLQSQK